MTGFGHPEAMTEVLHTGESEALFGISFADVFRAEEYLVVLRGLASHRHLILRDAVVVFKDEQGVVRVRETHDLQPAGAAVTGGLWTGLLGLLVGGPVGWLAGVGVGAGVGAITAKVIDTGIPDEWVDWFKIAVQTNTVTVIALATNVDLRALNDEVSRFAGAELVHTTLRAGAAQELAASLAP